MYRAAMAAPDFDPSAPEVLVWADQATASLAGEVLERMGSTVRAVGVAGPRDAGVDRLAKTCGLEAGDDLRHLLVDRPARYALLASLHCVTPADIALIRETGCTVLLLEPMSVALADLEPALAQAAAEIVFLPSMRQSPGTLAAADPADALGPIHQIAYRSVGPAGHGSLHARLFDAWATLLTWTDLPEVLTAHIVRADTSSTSTPVPRSEADAQSHRVGWVTAHGRIAPAVDQPGTAGGVGVSVVVSDCSVTHQRRLEVMGRDGQLTLDDAGYRLVARDAKGQPVVDQGEDFGEPLDYAELIARQWRRLIDRRSSARDEPPALRHRQTMACCMTCHLSARTGQGESPRRLLEIQG